MGRPKGSKNKKYAALGIDPVSREWRGFRDQKNNARRRGIPFKLTYDEWLTIWRGSGKLSLRGTRKGSYVMSRIGDKGAYEVGNVKIQSHIENSSAPHFGKHYLLGTKQSTATRQKRSRSLSKYYALEENRVRQSIIITGWWKKRKEHPL